MYYSAKIKSPLGTLIAIASDDALCALFFEDHKEAAFKTGLFQPIALSKTPLLEKLEHELGLYFNGELKEFSIPLDLSTGTDFQQQCWQALLHVPFGKTHSYAQQAQNIQQPKAVRAVANANGKNRISILVPCHRVIQSNGALGGYAGGINRKQALLELERSA